MSFRPTYARGVHDGYLDAPATKLDEHPRGVAERHAPTDRFVDQADLLGAGNRLQADSRPFVHAPKKASSVWAFPHRAGRHGPVTSDLELLHLARHAGKPFHRFVGRGIVDASSGENPVAKTHGQPRFSHNTKSARFIRLRGEEADRVRAAVNGRDAWKSRVYFGSS